MAGKIEDGKIRTLGQEEWHCIARWLEEMELAVNAMIVHDNTVNVLVKISKRSFTNSPNLAAEFLKEDCIAKTDYMLENNENKQIARSYSFYSGQNDLDGVRLLIHSDPSEEMLELYINRGIYSAKELLNEAKRQKEKEILYRIASVTNLSTIDLIEYLDF